MALHNCTECGLLHDHEGTSRTDPAVEIARIEADRDVRVAELSHRSDRDSNDATVTVAETEADAAVTVAEVEAESGVQAAEAVADALAPPEPEPVVVVADPPAETEPEVDDGPPEIEPASPAPTRKPNPWW